ncbi:GNAT family N-acetyltransferase [Psychroflexus aestuariivivens]|uniref:GNAT family N-acetyltransferase n=1 Tax=Psychroflexus aestuariivivens TaxID=1795040 RepID=UPI000FDA7269|nr:GNAT family N-acetyltransferase [Psychroflexus aestuariivivens]
MSNIQIRKIKQSDNSEVAEMIRYVLVEQGAPKVGTAYEDPILDELFEYYDTDRAAYFVILEDGKIMGSAGISHLEGAESEICELQKMYFHPKVRGRGLGAKMMSVCLDFARANDFKKCYIETLPNMTAAQKLYKKTGFEYIENRLGNTGHYSCTIFMLKKL